MGTTKTILVLLMLLCAAPAWAINGHFLHGVGARNLAMGGAGTAVPTDTLTALNSNPALLTRLDGEQQFQFGFELLDGHPEVESEVQTPFGPFVGTTENESDVNAIPSFGWSRHGERRVAYGMGAMGLAGYLTDYPQDPTNPVLAPQPQGFGRVNSEYQYLKLPFAVAWNATEDLSIGVAVTLGQAQLSATPAVFAAPDCSSPVDCYYPAANKETALGYGFQVGVYYEPTPRWSFGASYLSEQRFEDFEFNSEHANPNLPNFGQGRRLEFNVDLPAIASVGLGWRPTDRWTLALDGRWIGYDGVDGFGTFGFNPDGSVNGFGWDDIVVVAFGAEFTPSERWTLRAGYNSGESPIVPERAAASTPAPATFEDQASVGLGYRFDESMSLDLAFYKAFEEEVSGPILGPQGPIPGSRITHRNSSESVALTFSFTTR